MAKILCCFFTSFLGLVLWGQKDADIQRKGGSQRLFLEKTGCDRKPGLIPKAANPHSGMLKLIHFNERATNGHRIAAEEFLNRREHTRASKWLLFLALNFQVGLLKEFPLKETSRWLTTSVKKRQPMCKTKTSFSNTNECKWTTDDNQFLLKTEAKIAAVTVSSKQGQP